MSISVRRVRAIFRKELREYRRTRALIVAMAIFPLIFTIQPFVAVLVLAASASSSLAHEHVLLYLLGIPTLVPIFIAAYAVAASDSRARSSRRSRRPIRREELLLGKGWPPSSRPSWSRMPST